MSEADLIEAGQTAAAAGIDWWTGIVHDPRIDDKSPEATVWRSMITTWITNPEVGAGWSSWQHGGKGKTCKSYCGDLCFSWCGVFAGACWGPALQLVYRKRDLPSTFRLKEWGDGTARRLQVADIRAGDIVVVKTSGKLAYGDHVTIATGPVEGDRCPTVEGNGVGEGPDGKAYQGVIRNRRPVKDIRRVFRPLVTDLTG